MPKVSETVPLLLREVYTVRHGSVWGLERSLVLLEDVVVCHLFEVAKALDLFRKLLELFFFRYQLVGSLFSYYLVNIVHNGLDLLIDNRQFLNV